MRVCYVLSGVDYSNYFLWIGEALMEKEVNISFIFLADKKPRLHSIFQKKGIQTHFISFNHNVLSYVNVLRKLISIFIRGKFNVIHSHFIHASLLSLFAAKVVGIKSRIYTRHHSTFHHDYFPHAVKYDRLINLLATEIVSISSVVSKVLESEENVDINKIHLIKHGIKLEDFRGISTQRILKVKNRYNLPNEKVIIGVISRYVSLKGHEFIIKAFKDLYLHLDGNCHLVLANAKGPYKDVIKNELDTQLPSENCYTEIQFEVDVLALYKNFDIFVHVPVNKSIEAFGQIYLEALAIGIPSVFTLSGIASDFIEDKKNALVVDYKNSGQIKRAIVSIIENKKLRDYLVRNGKESVKAFSIERMIFSLLELYKNSLKSKYA